MTTRHLVAHRDLSLLSNIAANELVNSGRKLIAVLTGEYLNINNNAGLTVRDLKGVVSYFLCLLTENSSQESFLGSKLGLALRCYLTDKDITRSDLSTDADNSSVIEVLESVLTNVGDISCDSLRTELGVSFLDLVFLDVDRCVNIS